MKKIKEKVCTLCMKRKPLDAYPETDRGKGKSEYCVACKEKYQHHILLYNHANTVIDAVTQEEADTLLLVDEVEFKQRKYKVKNHQHYLKERKGKLVDIKTPTDKVLSVGKYNEKRKALSRKVAEKWVNEKAAVWENDHLIRYLFSGKELEQFVVKRDKEICYYCGEKGDRLAFHISRTEGGILSPVNSICCCQTCKETEGENLFLYKWLNMPILKKEERNEASYKIYDKRQQTSFYISKKTAATLLNEEMTEKIDEKILKIIYDKREFREYILQRDNHTCQYCQKPGDTLDHVLPQTEGGMTTPKNCVIACTKCNEKKGHLPLNTFLDKKK